ncbi:MAG: PG0541 family transporter-associated protein [candidate division FCPU426 bacterium]
MPTQSGTRSPKAKLNLYWLIFNVALETDVKQLLATFELKAFSRWDEVKGSGRSGPHLNDEVWPMVNALYVFAAPASLEARLARAVEAIRKQFPGEGIKLIVQPCSAVH